MLATASWPWLFWVNLPVGAIGLWLGARLIPRGEPGPSASFDLLGFVLVAVGLPARPYVVGSGSRPGLGTATLLGVGVAALAVFVRRSLRRPAPLLAVRLFGRRVFAAAAVTSFLVGAIQIGALVVWALYFQLVQGFGLVAAGLALVGFALGTALLPLAGRLTDRHGGAPVALAGTLLATVVLVPLALLPGDIPLAGLEAAMFVLGVANALSVVPTSTAAYVGTAPAEMPHAVTQMNVLLRFGGAVGSAVVVAAVGDQTQSREQLLSGFGYAYWYLAAASALSAVGASVLVRGMRATSVAAPAGPGGG